jgi:hypothetical protein
VLRLRSERRDSLEDLRESRACGESGRVLSTRSTTWPRTLRSALLFLLSLRPPVEKGRVLILPFTSRQVRSIADVTLAVANGDLSRKIDVEVKGEMLDLKVRLPLTIPSLLSPAHHSSLTDHHQQHGRLPPSLRRRSNPRRERSRNGRSTRRTGLCLERLGRVEEFGRERECNV